tara:strand:- start:4126 stop:5253 length:1128 start_codon:yes stop_codon:yes gene_type:complete
MNKEKISDVIAKNFLKINKKIKSELIKLVESDGALTIDSIGELSSMIFNTDQVTKGMRKAILRVLSFDEPDLNACHFAYVAARLSKEITPEHIVQRLNNQQTNLFDKVLDQKEIKLPSLKVILNNTSCVRILKFLWESGDSIELLPDTLTMIMSIKEDDPELELLKRKKIKKLVELHNIAQRTASRLAEGDYSLEQRDDILALNNVEFGEDMVIKVPETHFDLVRLGDSLEFCIGNGSYSRSVKERKSSIIAVFQKGAPLYGIQFTRYTIKEAHGFANKRQYKPSYETLAQLEKLILKEPTRPDDFLPITDSSFIKGYKYDNTNLYLQLKTSIYVYFNVPNHVYEELLDSDRKGGFLNKNIKPDYECEYVGEVED